MCVTTWLAKPLKPTTRLSWFRRGWRATRLHPAAAARSGSSPSSIAPRTPALPRIHCFRFGPAYPISKLLKLFKLSSQHLNTKTYGKRTIGRLSAITQYAT